MSRPSPLLGSRARTPFRFAPLGIVGVLLLSGLLVGLSGAASTAASPRNASDGVGTGLLDGAEHSLSLGLGPAGGASLRCATTSALSGRCATRSAALPAPAVLPAGSPGGSAGWQNLTANQITDPGANSGSMMAYLPRLGGVVMIGGTASYNSTQTWLFKGGYWSDITANVTGAPPLRWSGGLVYDAADGYLLLFGGRDSTGWFNDTWTFNGSTWTNLSPSHSPEVRAFFTMVYDPTDGYVVLFSGGCWCGVSGSRIVYNDTWTYRAGAWTDLTPSLSVSPPQLQFDPGAWDAHDGYLLVFGGGSYGYCAGTNLTWSFVGGVWTNRTIGSHGPTVLGGNSAMAYDPVAGVAVYFGGFTTSSCSAYGGTWTYQNGTWENVTSQLGGPSPPPSRGSALAWDAGDGYTLLFGGITNSGALLSSTFALYLNSSFLVRATASPTGGAAPLAVHFVASASGGASPYTYTWAPGDASANSTGAYFNHTYTKSGVYHATVLVNDSASNSTQVNLTITVTSDSWYNFPSSAVQPPWSYGAAMTYDPQINGILLFGGQENVYPYGLSDQTWEYVGGVWQNISSGLALSPSARDGASLVYDVNDSYAVLFGGFSPSCTTTVGNYTSYYYCNDTWEFLPALGWLPIITSPSPPARYNFAMADDPADGYVVLFGGQCASCDGGYYGLADDTWIFRAGHWTDWTSNTTNSPKAEYYTSATYDAAARAVIMYGGASSSCTGSNPGTWSFSGGNWTDVTSGTQPPTPYDATIAYDTARREAVLIGGFSDPCSGKIYNETWTYSNGTWTDATTTTVGAPPTDYLVSMAYDDAAGAVIFLGDEGLYYTTKTVQSVWSWPGTPLVTTTSATPSEGVAPFNVTFSASTAGGTSPYTYTWQFGDGSANATGGTVSHRFDGVGNYTVVVTANDTVGRSSVVSMFVVGYQHLLASPATTATIGQVPWPVHFYGNATGGVPPLSWYWTFGDGGTSTAASPLHTYTVAGNYTAELTLRDSSGLEQNWTFPIEAVPKLAAAPTATPALGQTPLTVDFAAGDTGGLGPYSYNWSFGDGSANSTLEDPVHTYPTVGSYAAQFEVSDSLGDVARGTVLVSVTVPLVATPSVSPSAGIAPLTVRFIDQSTGGSLPYNVSWNFGDGSPVGYGATVDRTYTTPGVYNATETVTDGVGTVAQQVEVITVVTPLSASMTANASLVLRSASVQFDLVPSHGEGPFAFSYKFGDGGTSTGFALANHTFSTDGTFEVRGTITDALHESATAFFNVTVVAPLVATITASPQSLVLGQTLNLSAGAVGGVGPYAYLWTGLPPGCVSSDTVVLSCQPSAAANYTVSVRVQDRSGQNITASLWVLVTAPAPGGGGGGSTSNLPAGTLLALALAVVVLVAIAAAALLLRRRRTPPTQAEVEEPVSPEEYAPPTGEEPPYDGPPGEP
jgi:PKD repeat protein